MQIDALRGTDRRSQAGPESLKDVAAQLTQRFADLSSDIAEQINAMRGGFRQGFSERSHQRSGSGKPLQIDPCKDCFNFGHWAGDNKSPMFAGAFDRRKPQWLKGSFGQQTTTRKTRRLSSLFTFKGLSVYAMHDLGATISTVRSGSDITNKMVLTECNKTVSLADSKAAVKCAGVCTMYCKLFGGQRRKVTLYSIPNLDPDVIFGADVLLKDCEYHVYTPVGVSSGL